MKLSNFTNTQESVGHQAVVKSALIERYKANNAVKPFACGSLGRSALRVCSRMASPVLRDQPLLAERRLPER